MRSRALLHFKREKYVPASILVFSICLIAILLYNSVSVDTEERSQADAPLGLTYGYFQVFQGIILGLSYLLQLNETLNNGSYRRPLVDGLSRDIFFMRHVTNILLFSSCNMLLCFLIFGGFSLLNHFQCDITASAAASLWMSFFSYASFSIFLHYCCRGHFVTGILFLMISLAVPVYEYLEKNFYGSSTYRYFPLRIIDDVNGAFWGNLAWSCTFLLFTWALIRRRAFR